jgi:hypothetical protein
MGSRCIRANTKLRVVRHQYGKQMHQDLNFMLALVHLLPILMLYNPHSSWIEADTAVAKLLPS